MKFFFLAFILISLCSCEKTIQLTVQDQPEKLVVNAVIENNVHPFVQLSASFNYFSTITPEELSNSFVHEAMITINDGATTELLKEFSFTDTSGYTFYYYTVNDNDPTGGMLGKFNTQYQLNIKTKEGEEYSATATIPSLAKTCDSIWWQPAPSTDDTTKCVMFGKFTDPKGLGNYIRYFTKVNSGNFLSGLNSVYDDQVVDGQTYSLQFDIGYDKNSTVKPDSEDYGYAYRGDTVTLKFCNIDKATFTFWNTWDFAYQSYGNPFSSPIKVLGNISNGALGVFSGYAAQYKTIIIPK
jgi:hypothetical protein